MGTMTLEPMGPRGRCCPYMGNSRGEGTARGKGHCARIQVACHPANAVRWRKTLDCRGLTKPDDLRAEFAHPPTNGSFKRHVLLNETFKARAGLLRTGNS